MTIVSTIVTAIDCKEQCLTAVLVGLNVPLVLFLHVVQRKKVVKK